VRRRPVSRKGPAQIDRSSAPSCFCAAVVLIHRLVPLANTVTPDATFDWFVERKPTPASVAQAAASPGSRARRRAPLDPSGRSKQRIRYGPHTSFALMCRRTPQALNRVFGAKCPIYTFPPYLRGTLEYVLKRLNRDRMRLTDQECLQPVVRHRQVVVR
jgi:hypothetical protein